MQRQIALPKILRNDSTWRSESIGEFFVRGLKTDMPELTDGEKEYYSLVKRVFDLLAPFYDFVALPISGVRDKVVLFANATRGSGIMDVATGTGKQTFAFAKRGYDVTGIDITESMLKVAIKKNKYGNAKFVIADATNLPFEDNRFDVSCVSFALHDMPLSIRGKALREMMRVTKPKGMIIVVDYALPKNRIGRSLIYHFIRLYEREYYTNFIKSDLEGLLKESGVEVIARLPVLLGAARILKGMKGGYDVPSLLDPAKPTEVLTTFS